MLVMGMPSEAELNAQLAALVGGNPGLMDALVALRGDAALPVTVENAGSAPGGAAGGAVTEDVE
jgi:anti-sigma-K factor RskA